MLVAFVVAGLVVGAVLGYALAVKPDTGATNERFTELDAQLADLKAGMDILNSSINPGLSSLVGVKEDLKFFFKASGVEGSSTDAGHENWIEVLSFSWGVGRGSAQDLQAAFSDFVIYKMFDKSSPKLAKACCDAQLLNNATLETVKGSVVVMKIVLVEVIVSSMRQGSFITPNDALPSESISFNFQKIRWEYTPLDADGNPLATIVAGWDVETNLPWT